MPRIHFLDVTNRDGVQTARTGLSKFGKTMVNVYLARLGVAQSEIGFPFLFHEVPYVRAQVALADAGALGDLRLSGWCRAVVADVEASTPLGLKHYNLSISTSDQMLQNKFKGRLDRAAIIRETQAAVRAAKAGGAETVGVNAEDGSRTDEGFLTEFALAAREAGADRLRYCDTIGGDTPGRSRTTFLMTITWTSGSPGWRERSACPSRRTATTTWAWRSQTRWPAPSATWPPGRTRGSTRASTASASAPATPTWCPPSWRCGTVSACRTMPRSAIRST